MFLSFHCCSSWHGHCCDALSQEQLPRSPSLTCNAGYCLVPSRLCSTWGLDPAAKAPLSPPWLQTDRWLLCRAQVCKCSLISAGAVGHRASLPRARAAAWARRETSVQGCPPNPLQVAAKALSWLVA